MPSGSRFTLSAPRHTGPITDHFNGRQFVNQEPMPARSLGDVLRWQLDFSRERGTWGAYHNEPPAPPPPRTVDGAAIRVTFINHATLLVQAGGVNILTDPIWSRRASPFGWIGPARVRPPGIRFDDLPPIHVVLVSHNHYDHLDAATLQALARRHRPRFLVALGNAALLARYGIGGAEDMDWYESRPASGAIRITAVPARHWSSRGFSDRAATLWCGYAIEAPGGLVYFAADSGYGRHFAEIRDRVGSPRVALLPIGAYLPRWFMEPFHLSPDDALQAHADLGAQTSLATHFGTFNLADDGETQPVEVLRARLAWLDGSAPDFRVPRFGEAFNFGPNGA